jgi:hypothetical protein
MITQRVLKRLPAQVIVVRYNNLHYDKSPFKSRAYINTYRYIGEIEMDKEFKRPKVSHYEVGGIETIDFIESKLSKQELVGYLKGNVIKYLSRADHKDSANSDYEKALVYMNWLVQAQSSKA